MTVLSARLSPLPQSRAQARPTGHSGENLAQLRELAVLLAEHEGRLIPTKGDDVLAVFANPSDAVVAAVAAQRAALAARRRPSGAHGGAGRPPRLRVGLSIGEITGGDGDLQGQAILIATRLGERAGAGQILAARAVHLVAGRTLPVGATDAGELSLRDVADVVQVDDISWTELADRPLRILLADDAVLIREGVTRLLEEEGFTVVGVTEDASRLVALTAELSPDVVITDVRMPPTFTLEGLRAAVELRKRFPAVGVLVLSHYLETRYAIDLLGNGAQGVGYLLKERVGAVDDFLAAIRRVAARGTAIDPEMITVLMGRSRREGGLDRLSPREREILSLMAEGLSNTGIARHLTVAVRTVESHVGSIFTKLGLLPELVEERRVLAVIEYLRGSDPAHT